MDSRKCDSKAYTCGGRCAGWVAGDRSRRRHLINDSAAAPGSANEALGRTPMRLLSIKVGLPRDVDWRGKTGRTSIFKSPVLGRVRVTRLNVEGDQQSNLSVHGGTEKAVYAYPSEHYAFWREELPGLDLPWGAFGENFTTEGLLEGSVGIGDRLRVGSAEFVVTQPRTPCF